jgi:hypothetical protein
VLSLMSLGAVAAGIYLMCVAVFDRILTGGVLRRALGQLVMAYRPSMDQL